MTWVRSGVSVLFLAACGAPGDHENFLTRDSAGVVIAEHGNVLQGAACEVTSAPVVTIGTAEGAEESELYRVFGATRLADGRIVLVNDGSKELRFFDADGQFLHRAGRGGEGPGEFRNAFYLWRLPGDTLWVGNYSPWQYHVFGPDGTFHRTVTPMPAMINTPELMGLLADGRAALASRDMGRPDGPEYRPRYSTVVLHGSDGSLQDTLGTFLHGRWGLVGESAAPLSLFPLFESFTRMAVGGNRIAVAHTASPEVSIYDAREGAPRLAAILRWTTGDRRVTNADITAERERLAAENPTMEPSMRQLLVEPVISSDRPVADVFPAFSSLLLGRDDRIWVRAYPRPDQPEAPNAWTVFLPDGRFDCQLTLPRRTTLLEADRDYFLGHHRDEDGVEQVVMYRLGS